ncbi:hypothetical protein [Bradyrhizobium roseum]|uniref:hypothetical protein n=1 Tax=Bradyrhizobium roseum TaxID=3056648 RepID=UPI0026112512|nr:hypothetical protein [Bradyrhizobium roseus]WKA26996.1 hypothetical protein QUH67_25955 [Bradyrhizobium roseus]
MNAKAMADASGPIRDRLGLALLLYLYIVVCCASLVCVAAIYPEFHIFFQPAGLFGAVTVIALFSVVAILLIIAEFSFGYCIAFYFYMMAIGYLWLNYFSGFNYNHRLSALSAAASALAFLLPALFITSPLRQVWSPSPRNFGRLLNLLLLTGAATVAIGASYNFRLIAINEIYSFRDELTSPAIVNYMIGITSTALLPFAFACFVERKDVWRAGAVLLLLLCYYPITLSKLALFSPVWLVGMLVLSKLFEVRATVVVSLLGLAAFGILLFVLYKNDLAPYEFTISYFGLVNFRMIAIPSLAMDYYNEFFFRHDLTHFCQIRFLKPLMTCPYQDQLSVVIYNAFGIGGNFNASLFATEGIASVGAMFAPVAVFAGGLIIGLANRMSSGLPPRLILISGAILVQVLLNVPFTTVLLTHGGVFLFLLWYIAPRAASDAR